MIGYVFHIIYYMLYVSLFSDLDKPTFNTSSQSIVPVIEGRYLSVVCNASSNPNANYRWSTSSGKTISNTRNLVFSTIKRIEANTYTCIVNNSVGLEKNSSLTIDVQCEYKLYLMI